MLDELAFIGRLIHALGVLAQIIFDGLPDLILNRFTYASGWLALRVVTLGKRPRGPAFPTEYHGMDLLVALLGSILLLAAILVPVVIVLAST